VFPIRLTRPRSSESLVESTSRIVPTKDLLLIFGNDTSVERKVCGVVKFIAKVWVVKCTIELWRKKEKKRNGKSKVCMLNE